jgi:hypothetical protein
MSKGQRPVEIDSTPLKMSVKIYSVSSSCKCTTIFARMYANAADSGLSYRIYFNSVNGGGIVQSCYESNSPVINTRILKLIHSTCTWEFCFESQIFAIKYNWSYMKYARSCILFTCGLKQ